MLARETRTRSFAESSDNVMSELLRAIRKVRGDRTNTDDEHPAVDSNGNSIMRNSNPVSNGFPSVNGNTLANSASHNSTEVQSASVDIPINRSVGTEDNSGSVSKETSSGSVPPAPLVPLPPPPPPIPSPQSGEQIVTHKPTTTATTTHVPSWTPNRPRRFVPDNTINVFDELNSVLKKRFRRNEEENAEKNESSNDKSDSSGLKSPKKTGEKRPGHYSHIKEVSEKLVNGLNIVIVEQGGKKGEERGLTDSSQSSNETRPAVAGNDASVKTNIARQLSKGTNHELIKLGSNGVASEEETSRSSQNVSELIKSYQSSQEGLSRAPSSPQRLTDKGIYQAKPPNGERAPVVKSENTVSGKTVTENISLKSNGEVRTSEEQHGKRDVFRSANGQMSPNMKQNDKRVSGSSDSNGEIGISEAKSTSVRQNDAHNMNGSQSISSGGNSISQDSQDKNKMASSVEVGKSNAALNSSEDEELVKAVVVHGSTGKGYRRRQLVSTMTETALASIMLDKAIDSDTEPEVFHEVTLGNKQIGVSDSEINRYKAEIFGESAAKEGNTYEKERKEIKEVLVSTSAPTSVRSQNVCRTSIIESRKTLKKSNAVEDIGVKDVELVTSRDKNQQVTTDKKADESDVTVSNHENMESMPDEKSLYETNMQNGDEIKNQSKSNMSEKQVLSKMSMDFDDFQSPDGHSFSRLSSETSSLDSNHNSSAEVVVVADVHVSSDDDKVLEFVYGKVSTLSNDSAVHGHGSNQLRVQDQDNSTVRYPVGSLSSDADVVAGNSSAHMSVRALMNAENEKAFPFREKNEQGSQVGKSEDNVARGSRVSAGSSVAMDTETSGSITSSLANYDYPDQTIVPENFAHSSVKVISPGAPIQQSSPNLRMSAETNSSSRDHTELSHTSDSPAPSAIDFSEEELEIHLSDPESGSAVLDDQGEIKDSHLLSTHSPSASLTDAEVRNLTTKIAAQQRLLASDSDLGFKSLRSSTHRDDESEESHFRPVVSEPSQFPSSEAGNSSDGFDAGKKLPAKTPSPNFVTPASVIRYESPHLVGETVEKSRETTAVVSNSLANQISDQRVPGGKSRETSTHQDENANTMNFDSEGETSKSPDMSATVISYTSAPRAREGIGGSSVADTSKEQMTVINHSLTADDSKETVTVINHVTPKDNVVDKSPAEGQTSPRMVHHIPVNVSHEICQQQVVNNNDDSYEPVSALHYGPPHGIRSQSAVTQQNREPTVIRYVPVSHTAGFPRYRHGNLRHHHHPGHGSHNHAGQHHHFNIHPFNAPHVHTGPVVYTPPRGKATTMFYDFNHKIAVPRRPSGESQQSHYSKKHSPGGHYSSHRYPENHSAVTVMHISPTRGHHQHGPQNLSAYVKETRPKVAGYGPDALEMGHHGAVSSKSFSSHDTLTSLPLSSSSRVAPVVADVHRKPSYTVMTSSTSSFGDSGSPDRVFIDLRKPKHRRHRSRSPEKNRANRTFGESMKSETDSSFSRTVMSETVSTDLSNVSHNAPASMSVSSEENEDAYKHSSNRIEEYVTPEGVSVKIFSHNESKVIIGTMETSEDGSPFIIDVGEGRMPTANGDGLYRGEEDRPATFYVDARGLRGELGVQVEGPNSIAKCNIEPERDGVYAVTYVPVEVGKYRAIVKWNGKEIPGSPFHPKVVDARKVKVVGGWQHFMDSNDRVHLLVDEEKRIPFDVSEAGPGILKAEVRGPGGKIPCHVEENGSFRRTICFTPREEGDHHIYAYWSDHTLVNAPFHGYAVSRRRSPDPTKVILSGRGLKEAIVHREAEFQIDGSEAGPGRPEVQLTGLKRNIPVRVSSLGGGRYRCTYIPETAGAYLLHITWNERQLRGSPFKVNVINAHYPQKVVVSGEGLKGGVMGRDINVIIDTRKAGPGELTAHCMGPHLVAYCELEDMRDGTYKLNIRPQEPGRHILQIKYGGEHVLGSPYVLRVGAQPDASKVRVSGPGVEHGILANFESRFIVETRGAGAGQLTVRIRGPKGAFQVEMLRDSQKDRTILCRFDPTETGLYQIFVKWSGVDVPGSPFQVYIVDSQHELMRVMQGQIPAHYQGSTLNRSVYNSEYSSWREEDNMMRM